MTTPNSTKAEKMKSFWDEGIVGNAEYVSKAIKDYGFYEGGDKQWDSGDIARLNKQRKPHLSINLILPTVNLLAGYERQNRNDIKVYPKRGGVSLVADLLTALAKHSEDLSNGIYERSMMFLDGLVGIKGWICLDVSYQDDPYNGEIIIERINPYDIVEDPNCNNYDLNKGAKYIIRSYWADKDRIRLLYPKSESDIDDLKYDDLDKRDTQHLPGSDKNPDKFKCRMRETWWKSYEKATYLFNEMTLDRKRVDKSKIDLMKRILEIDRRQAEEEDRPTILTVREEVVPVLNCTTTLGKIVLEDVERPYGEMYKFPLQRFVPYWINGNCFGVVDNLISPQQEKNKRRSQTLHILNQSANSGWKNKKEGGAEPEVLRQFGSEPGVVLEYETVPPEQITPTPISTAHITLEQLAGDDVKEISSVNANLLAQGKSGESGILDRQRQQQGLVGVEIMFDNYKLTQQIYSETIIELIRNSNVFSAQEIIAIAGDERIEANIDQLMQSMKSIRVGKYGVKVDQSPNNPTIRMANFEILMQVAQLFPGIISPDILIDASDIPKKEEIMERIRQQMAMAQQMQMQQMQAQNKAQQQQAKPQRRQLQKV